MECRDCEGDKEVVSQDEFGFFGAVVECLRCNGTGVEPVEPKWVTDQAIGVSPIITSANDEEKPIPTLAEWREGWEAESDEGRRQTISWEEAERRYCKQYGRDDGHQNGEG